MKRLLNTLYVTQENSYLAREGTNVLVRMENQNPFRIPIHTLGAIVCFGNISASPSLMHLCGESGVALSFFSFSGRFLARMEGPCSGNVLLRVAQHRETQDLQSAVQVARPVVAAKIINCRALLQRAAREGRSLGTQQLSQAAQEMKRLAQSVPLAEGLEEVRGIEGEAARIYFSVFDHLILTQKQDFCFRKRSRRPPLDLINALLSFLYTMLANDVCAALQGIGLDPQLGFLHRLRPGRPSLSLDIMEELRGPLADRLALSLINRNQVRASGFERLENGAIRMDEATRKLVISAWQERKREEVRHPFLNEKMQAGLVPHVQALLLSRYLRGDLDGYPPMIWK